MKTYKSKLDRAKPPKFPGVDITPAEYDWAVRFTRILRCDGVYEIWFKVDNQAFRIGADELSSLHHARMRCLMFVKALMKV